MLLKLVREINVFAVHEELFVEAADLLKRKTSYGQAAAGQPLHVAALVQWPPPPRRPEIPFGRHDSRVSEFGFKPIERRCRRNCVWIEEEDEFAASFARSSIRCCGEAAALCGVVMDDQGVPWPKDTPGMLGTFALRKRDDQADVHLSSIPGAGRDHSGYAHVRCSTAIEVTEQSRHAARSDGSPLSRTPSRPSPTSQPTLRQTDAATLLPHAYAQAWVVGVSGKQRRPGFASRGSRGREDGFATAGLGAPGKGSTHRECVSR